MSFLDKIAATLAPPESDEDRATAHREAKALAPNNPWLQRALSHHEQIEAAFATALNSPTQSEASRAVKDLSLLLIAHSVAEEVALYPVLVMEGHKAHATEAYQEQQMTKVQLAELERLQPLTEDWRDKLEHIRGAVLHHIYREESTWFPEIVRESQPGDLAMIDARFSEEFDRSMGKPSI
jgi:iron-sulfur cluster repair protein YtfE (RIC family)